MCDMRRRGRSVSSASSLRHAGLYNSRHLSMASNPPAILYALIVGKDLKKLDLLFSKADIIQTQCWRYRTLSQGYLTLFLHFSHHSNFNFQKDMMFSVHFANCLLCNSIQWIYAPHICPTYMWGIYTLYTEAMFSLEQGFSKFWQLRANLGTQNFTEGRQTSASQWWKKTLHSGPLGVRSSEV
jgi:hypothetical protein